MHRIFIIVILLSIFTGYIFSEEQKYPEKIETEGTLETWAWANKQNKFALLIENKGIYDICYIKAESLQCSPKFKRRSGTKVIQTDC